MMERLLERISLSEYKDSFVLKGGMLVAALVGVESRSTVDMDTTLKHIVLNKITITAILEELLAMDIDDGVSLTLMNVDEIRDEAEYHGFRASVEARLDTARIPFKIDITTGDKITPKEVKRQYKLLIENRTIEVCSYNIETVLAEKLETVISRNITNTRMRDFYDIHILLRTQIEDVNPETLKLAVQATAESRKTFHLFKNGNSFIREVIDDEVMKSHWERYQKKYEYAKHISWIMIEESLVALWKMQE
jgi:hypothetical protein